jgi:hypothetical protein
MTIRASNTTVPTRGLIAAQSLASIVRKQKALHQTKIGLGFDALRRWCTVAIWEVEDSAAHPADLGVELGNFIGRITRTLTVKIDEPVPLASSPAFVRKLPGRLQATDWSHNCSKDRRHGDNPFACSCGASTYEAQKFLIEFCPIGVPLTYDFRDLLGPVFFPKRKRLGSFPQRVRSGSFPFILRAR